MTVSATPAARGCTGPRAPPGQARPGGDQGTSAGRRPTDGHVRRQALSAERSEPAWLRAERLAAFAAYDALPVEGNRLYTPYVDLRAADLAAVQPYPGVGCRGRRRARRGLAPCRTGAACVIELREDGVPVCVLSAEARAAGVAWSRSRRLSTRATRPAAGRLLEGGASLPADDKLAQLARGFWSQGVRLDVPAGVRPRPAHRHSLAGRRSRGALSSRGPSSRSARTSGLRLVEDLDAVRPADRLRRGRDGAPGTPSAGRTEVRLGADADLLRSPASRTSRPGAVAFQHRYANSATAPTLHWALAQLGGRLIRSRVDNRLEGDGVGRAGRDRVRVGRPAVRPHLVHPPHRPGHDRQPAQQGRPPGRGPELHEGPHRHRQVGGRHRQLPGRVRDEPLEAGPGGRDPQPGDRPAGLPAGRPRDLGRADRRDPALLPGESRDRPDEARKFIVLGFLEPVVAKVPLAEAQDRLRALLEEKWAAGAAAAARATPRNRRRPGRRVGIVRRVDLWRRRGPTRHHADGLGRRHRPGHRDQRRRRVPGLPRGSAATSTSSSTRGS